MTAPGVPATQRKKINGPKVLALAEPGSGKTHSIRTLLAAGLKVFVFFSEPGMEVLMDKSKGKVYTCAEGLHWTYIPPITATWAEMTEAADMISKFTYKALSDMNGMHKERYRQFYDFIAAHSMCKCDRCGVQFGDVSRLEPYNEWAVVLDSLSSLSIMAMNLVVGSKPVAHQGEWGVAMRNLETYINKFCYDIPSLAVMLAHIEREGDEVSGGQMNMAATLGKKLAPKIPRPFSDVIHFKRDGAKFTWSTITPNMTLKTRSLPWANDIPPDFMPIVRKWQEHVKTETEYFEQQQPLP